MRRGPLVLALTTAVALMAALTPASAELTEEFFEEGNASAGWVSTAGPPGSTEDASIALTVTADNGSDFNDYAGAELFGASMPADPPSMWFKSTVGNAGSGGSPRITIVFNNGGVADLRPLSWTADTWTLLDGADPQTWDVRGSCSFIYNATWAQVQACEAGSGIDWMIVVSDSGWFHPGGYTHYVDSVTIGEDVLAYPSTCGADFTGSHENGPVSGPIHDVVEPAAAAVGAGDAVHGLNCDVVVGLGL